MIGFRKILIVAGKTFRRKMPRNIRAEHRRHFELNAEYSCPDVYLYRFSKVSLLPDSTLFLFGVWPAPFSFPFFKRRLRHHSIKGIIDIRRKWKASVFYGLNTPYLIIHDQWSRNFYHWMTQALPRLLVAMKNDSRFTLLLPEDHSNEFHFATLNLLGVQTWITFPTHRKYYHVFNLAYPSHDIQIGDYHDELIGELAVCLKKSIPKTSSGRLIFVTRQTPDRKILNAEEVYRAFKSRNFEFVDFEQLSFSEQATISRSASVLAGVHGAGLTQMMLMDKGSKVLELTSALHGEQYYYFTLSNALGHDYYYLHAKPEHENLTVQEANVWIDTDQLERILSEILNG